MRSTSPGIQPSPAVTSYSRPRSAMSLHADADAEERPALRRTVFLQRRHHAGHRVEPRRQSANAPTPGSTTRSARRTASGCARHQDRLVVSGLAGGPLECLAAEWRLPEP